MASETFLGWMLHILQTKEGLVSLSTFARSLPEQFGLVLASFLQKPGLPFADVLPEETVQAAFEEEGAAFGQEGDAVYTPAVTLWTFLSQVFFKEEQRSCAAAVARLVVLLVSLGRKPCSDNTGAFCRARAKLPESACRRLVYQVADGCEDALPDEWRWKSRRTYLVDGCTVSMPDTPESQAVYPQPNTQPPGVGFPLARLVVMLSLVTGMLGGLAIGSWHRHSRKRRPTNYGKPTLSIWPNAVSGIVPTVSNHARSNVVRNRTNC